jgi:hypothetical protein
MNYLITLLLLTIAAVCAAQTVRRVPVDVAHSGKDSVGQRIAFELREGIRGSQSMRLAAANEANPRIVVNLVSIDGNDDSPGNSTNLAFVVAYDSSELAFLGLLITASVQTCGTRRTQECARTLLSDIDAALEQMKRQQPAHYARLR